MYTHAPKSSNSPSPTGAPKAQGLAPRPFEVSLPGQEQVSASSNPFPPRRHEVWMGEPATRTAGNQGQEQTEPAGLEFDWNRISLYAEGQPPPEPPRWSRVQTKLAVGRSDALYEQEANRGDEPGMERPDPMIETLPTQPAQIQAKQSAPPSNSSHGDWFSHAPQRRPIPNLFQAKLTIGQPNDVYEQEADQVAERVMSMAPPVTPNIQRQMEPEESEAVQTKPLVEMITPLVQRQELSEDAEPIQAKCEACEQEEKVQRSADGTVQAKPDLEDRLNASKGGGTPLSEEVRSFMEPRFGADFSQVRVHTDGEAVQMNRELNAQAFTHGNHVYYGAGKAPANDELTGHELTHVVQQTVQRDSFLGEVKQDKFQSRDAKVFSKASLQGQVSLLQRQCERQDGRPVRNYARFVIPDRPNDRRQFEHFQHQIAHWIDDCIADERALGLIQSSASFQELWQQLRLNPRVEVEINVEFIWNAHRVTELRFSLPTIDMESTTVEGRISTSLQTEVVDAAYQLRLDRRPDGVTSYDPETRQYILSISNYRHLSRVNGFYFLTRSEINLITPPEVRQQTNGQSILMPISNAEFARFQQSDNPVHSIQALMQTHLGISVDSLTRSTAANEDFSVPRLPESVERVLSTASPVVSSGDRAAVEQQRRRAARMPQARTRSLAADRHEELPMEELELSDRMDPDTLFAMSDPALIEWIVGCLGRFQAQLFESSQAHQIPMQLLAVVILNELGDIGSIDALQDGLSTSTGSLGIAQIQVDTAMRDGLVDLAPGAARTGLRRAGSSPGVSLSREEIERGERLRTAQLLQVPQVAIEAAAREIELLLNRMARNYSRPWQIQHGFTATGPMGNVIYDHVGGGSEFNRERNLAQMVSGAYNSPDIITARDISHFPNATTHGNNAYVLAGELFRFQIFRTAARVSRTAITDRDPAIFGRDR